MAWPDRARKAEMEKNMAEIITLTASEIEKENLKELGTVLVDFWAPWCGPCRMLAPSVEKLAEEYQDQLTVGKLNVDDEADAAVKLGIMSIPTLVIFKDGEEADRLIGAVPPPQLKAFVEKNL